MFRQVIDNLKKESIVSKEEIKEIIDLIEIKYKEKSDREKKTLYYNAVHKMINLHLKEFNSEYKVFITHGLALKHHSNMYRDGIYKDEVILISKKLNIEDEDFCYNLLNFINNSQDKAIDIDELHKFLDDNYKTRVKNYFKNMKKRFEYIDFKKGIIYIYGRMKLSSKYIYIGVVFFILIFATILYINKDDNFVEYKENTQEIINVNSTILNSVDNVEKEEDKNNLPESMHYVLIDKAKLKVWLESKDSILSEDKYIDPILKAAKKYDLHPMLLFAILNQEQGLVPKSNEFAVPIANNPFNIFGSWKKYNTNIGESSDIAAKTVATISMDRPEDVDPIKWINLRDGQGGYAEDKNWHKGVNYIFNELRDEFILEYEVVK